MTSLEEIRRELREIYERLGGLPKPYFATHTIMRRGSYNAILGAEAIDLAVVGKPISLSLDGVFSVLGWPVQYTTFVFDLNVLRGAKPCIYLLGSVSDPQPVDRVDWVSTRNYYLHSWPYFYEAEILFEGSLPIVKARCGLPPRLVELSLYELERDLSRVGIGVCELPPSDFRNEVIGQYRLAEERKVYPIYKWKVPPPSWLGEFIHEYNQTICKLFQLNYDEIQDQARLHTDYIPWF